MRKAGAVKVVCPDCGETFSKMGLGPHRRGKHERRSVSKATGAHERDLDIAVGKVLRCECGDELVAIPDLIRHTNSAHQRGPRATERTPVNSHASAG